MNTLRAKQVQYAQKKRISMMTADQIKELIWIWVSTKTMAELARHFGCSKKTIQRIACDIMELWLIFFTETVYYRRRPATKGFGQKKAATKVNYKGRWSTRWNRAEESQLTWEELAGIIPVMAIQTYNI